ncbi:MAG: ester cyclase [Planctomycetota bacterium]|jgi:steroid delta-isomerase-like uncharacterized protein
MPEEIAIQDNRAVAARLLKEFYNDFNPSVAEELLTPGFTLHDPNSDVPLVGIDAYVVYISVYREAFEGFHMQAEDIIAEGDKVAVRWRASGVHKAELLGVPASGEEMVITGLTFYRFKDGKLDEAWTHWDALGLLRQLRAANSRRAADSA